MWIADGWEDYELLDCGGGEKLERWGKQILVRPDPQAIWETPRTVMAGMGFPPSMFHGQRAMPLQNIPVL